MYKKIHLIFCFFAFLSNVVTAQYDDDSTSANDDDATSAMQSAMWSSCTACLSDGDQFASEYLGGFNPPLSLVPGYACVDPGETVQCGSTGCIVISTTSNVNKFCTEAYCAQFVNEGACTSATNVQGTKYACSWSSSAGHCNISVWSAIKSFMIPIIVILCLCIVGCIVACVCMARKKKRQGGERQQETVIIQGGQTTPYAQMDDVVTVNSQI